MIRYSIRNYPRTLGAMALLCLMLVNTSALALDYTIEVVVFENMRGDKSTGSSKLYFPRAGSAIGLNSDKAAEAGFSLISDNLSLTDAVDKIRASGNYRLLKHFAWRQPGLDNKEAKAIRINIGQTLPVYIPESISAYKRFIPASAQPTPEMTRKLTTTTVNGSLKVRLRRFLHVDANLVFTDIENQRSYLLSQSRKMRSTEFHYIDNPRFGLLIRILPVPETAVSG